ncbi:ankyrin homolog [Corticium candelabrum]|uniref:ankyrin homolog n=1 Tax=Corticium candelabrum TaxID=121492 RepID=UPI002E25EF31|nr:ankyrin homolog [Corticium candelabrum]
MEELFTAVEKNDINKVTRLLEAGADVNGTNISGRPLLLVATHKKHEEMAIFLLSKGAHVNSTDRGSETALHLASAEGLDNLVWRLLKEGADATQRNRSQPPNVSLVHGHAPSFGLHQTWARCTVLKASATIVDNTQKLAFACLSDVMAKH